MGQGTIQESLTYGLSEAMAVDSRFHQSKKHGVLSRAGDPLLQSVTLPAGEWRSRATAGWP